MKTTPFRMVFIIRDAVAYYDSIYEDQELSPRAKSVLIYLKDHALLAGNQYHCRWGQSLPLDGKTGYG